MTIDVLIPHWAREMAVTSPFFSDSDTGGERAEHGAESGPPTHKSQRSAAPAVAAKMVAGAMAATGVTAVAAVGLGNRWWRRVVTVPSGPRPCGAGRREGAVVEARVASMVAQSEAVMATGVWGQALRRWRLSTGQRRASGGGLDRARGASTRYLLKGRGRYFGLTLSPFQSAATFQVAEPLTSPTGGRVWAGAGARGRAEKPTIFVRFDVAYGAASCSKVRGSRALSKESQVPVPVGHVLRDRIELGAHPK